MLTHEAAIIEGRVGSAVIDQSCQVGIAARRRQHGEAAGGEAERPDPLCVDPSLAVPWAQYVV
ncbi:MAG: hypothetical protein ACREEY_04365, partial [Brevundimonas sp.]